MSSMSPVPMLRSFSPRKTSIGTDESVTVLSSRRVPVTMISSIVSSNPSCAIAGGAVNPAAQTKERHTQRPAFLRKVSPPAPSQALFPLKQFHIVIMIVEMAGGVGLELTQAAPEAQSFWTGNKALRRDRPLWTIPGARRLKRYAMA